MTEARPKKIPAEPWVEDVKKWAVIIAFIIGVLSVLYLLWHG